MDKDEEESINLMMMLMRKVLMMAIIIMRKKGGGTILAAAETERSNFHSLTRLRLCLSFFFGKRKVQLILNLRPLI